MGSLPGMMYDQISAGAGANPVPTDRLWGAALTLILLIAHAQHRGRGSSPRSLPPKRRFRR